MAVDQQRFREVMGHFATGVAVVACAGPEGPSGLTTSAITSVSLDPPLLLVCFDNTSRTLPAVRDAGRFSVNMLREGQEDLAMLFASKVVMEEKWAAVTHASPDGVPVIDDALAWIACDVHELLPGGDHTIAIGAVTGVGADAGGGRPLLHHRGAFAGLHYAG
jgi:3-hydroxy-9,10-secoandrosta-1,3,5(10)-triene-9,17-dione monooxygenase reductase component